MKYPVLMTVSAIQRIVGWIAVAIGIIMIFSGLAGTANGQQNPYSAMAGIASLTSGFGIAIAGLFLVYAGESAKVLTDIEANTERTAEVLRTALQLLRQGAPAPVSASGAAVAASAGGAAAAATERCLHDWQVDSRLGFANRCSKCGTVRGAGGTR